MAEGETGQTMEVSTTAVDNTSGYMQVMPPDPTHKDCVHCVCQAGPTIGIVVHKTCCKCGERFAVDLTVTNPPLPFYPSPYPFHPSNPGWPYPSPTIIWCAVETRPGANC